MIRAIAWREGRYATFYGFIGERQMAHVSYTLKRNDPKPWHWRVEGLGSASMAGSEIDIDTAKVSATAALDRLVSELLEPTGVK